MSGGDVRNTLAVSLWAGQLRGAGPNSATIAYRMVAPPPRPRDLFVRTYATFAEKCRSVEEPGLAVIAVDERTGRAAGSVRLLSRVQRPVAAIVGRHDRCDLFLANNHELALRHLAVVLEPVTNWKRGSTSVRYRFLDLRTEHGMVGEDGQQLRGFVAEGPAVVHCGGYTMFALPLGDPSDWPESAADAWEMLPQRIYTDEVAVGTAPRIPLVLGPPRGHGLRSTFITRTQGVRDADGLAIGAGDAVGTLELTTPNRVITVRISESALRDGVLLGRYDRCDTAAAAQEDETMSRVHALLVRVEDRLMLIDTASSNGTYANDAIVRFVTLEPATRLRLGRRTQLRWVMFDS